MPAGGCALWGIDHSGERLRKAQRKLPDAILLQADLNHGLPEGLPTHLDRIVSGYTLHRFDTDRMLILIDSLASRLATDRFLVIADIAFETTHQLDSVRTAYRDIWDPTEHDWIPEEILPRLVNTGLAARFAATSFCAGNYILGCSTSAGASPQLDEETPRPSPA